MSDEHNQASVLIEVDWSKTRSGRLYTNDRKAVTLLSQIYGDSPEGLIAAAQQAGVPVALIARHAVPRNQVWAVWVEAHKHAKQAALVELISALYPDWAPALAQLVTDI